MQRITEEAGSTNRTAVTLTGKGRSAHADRPNVFTGTSMFSCVPCSHDSLDFRLRYRARPSLSTFPTPQRCRIDAQLSGEGLSRQTQGLRRRKISGVFSVQPGSYPKKAIRFGSAKMVGVDLRFSQLLTVLNVTSRISASCFCVRPRFKRALRT